MTDPAKTLKGVQLLQQAQALHGAGKLAEAAAAFARASALIPDHPGLLVAYGALAEEVKDWPAAEKIYRRLGQLRPQANVEGKIGLCVFRQERYAEAIPLFEQHLARFPAEIAVQLPLAQALCKEKRWEDALHVSRPLMAAHRSEVTVELVLNSLFNLARKEELDTLVDQAIADFPDSPFILALCGLHLLKCFDNRRGFAFQQSVRRRYEAHKPAMERAAADGWNGEKFDGVLLIDGEQGMGEEILGASMFSELVRIGQRAVISCEPRLLPLFRRSFPALEFVSRHGDELDRLAADGARHHRFQSIDLGCIFRRGEAFPANRAWLVADPDRVAELRNGLAEKFAGKQVAGISWKSKREYHNGPDKNVALADLAALLQLPAIAWLNIQYGDTRDDIERVAALGIEPPHAEPGLDPTQDIDGLAAHIAAFDFVVSTSNTTAHIAGALGVPCHLILPRTRPVLWYWGYDGSSTPWYPSIRIHRNPREDGWREFAGMLASELAVAVHTPHS